MNKNQEYEEFMEALDISNGRYKKNDVFRDFIITMALGIDSKYYKNKESEEYACRILEKYTNREIDKFMLLPYKLKKVYNAQYEIADILGKIYTQLNSQNKDLGQDFSPNSITKSMTEIFQIDEKIIQKEGYITLIEPSCRFRCFYLINGK